MYVCQGFILQNGCAVKDWSRNRKSWHNIVNKEERQRAKEAHQEQTETTTEFVAKSPCPIWIPSQ